jgi:hypothetical protein
MNSDYKAHELAHVHDYSMTKNIQQNIPNHSNIRNTQIRSMKHKTEKRGGIRKWPRRRVDSEYVPLLGGNAVKAHLLAAGFKGLLIEQALIVLHAIEQRSIFRRKTKEASDDAWVQLPCDYLNRIIGDAARRKLPKILCEQGLLKMKPWRNRGASSATKEYALTDFFASFKIEHCLISRTRWERYKQSEQSSQIESINACETHRRLWADLQTIKLHPECESAFPHFSGLEWKRELAWCRSQMRIDELDISFSHSPPRGRVYTTFAGTPSELRRYVTLNGIPTVSVDIQCSQPFLLGTLLDECEEKRRIINTAKQGSFYTDICEATSDIYDNCMSRKELKGLIFKEILYGPIVDDPVKAKMWHAFREIYPKTAELITHLKAENYKSFSILMQNLEAKIVIHEAVPTLYRQYPDIRILTVHDSIYVPESFETQAIEALRNSFEKHTGYIPSLHVEKSMISSAVRRSDAIV